MVPTCCTCAIFSYLNQGKQLFLAGATQAQAPHFKYDFEASVCLILGGPCRLCRLIAIDFLRQHCRTLFGDLVVTGQVEVIPFGGLPLVIPSK